MIAVLGSENPSVQLFIAQWRDYLLVMNGGLHQHLDSQTRLSVRFTNPIGSTTGVRVISSPAGSQLWLNENLVLKSPGQLRLPAEPGPIYFGNTRAGDRSWLGVIHRFSLTLDDRVYAMVPIAVENNVQLKIEPVAFFNPLHDDLRKLSDASLDILINFLGFIPLGFVLAIYLGVVPSKRQVVFALISIFIVSFMIEVSQIWMPARYSSYIDLLANTLGGAVGILLATQVFAGGRRGRIEKNSHGFD